MKNLLLGISALVGIIGSNKVLATVTIPEVDFMTRVIADNPTLNAIAKGSRVKSVVIHNSLIPNGLDSEQDSFFTVQATGQIKFESPLLEQVNSLFLPEFTIATTEIPTTDIQPQKSTLQLEKSLSKNSKKSYYPKVNRSNLIVNSTEGNASSNQLSLVNPAPKTKQITSSFGWRIRPFSGQRQFHQGIDYGAPLGSPVVAAGDGIVTKVVSGCADFRNISCGQQFGNRIEIDHGNGAIATYGHLLNNSIKITEGTKVWQNQEIAQVGSSGWSSGAHLDFRIKVNGEFQDPANFVKK